MHFVVFQSSSDILKYILKNISHMVPHPFIRQYSCLMFVVYCWSPTMTIYSFIITKKIGKVIFHSLCVLLSGSKAMMDSVEYWLLEIVISKKGGGGGVTTNIGICRYPNLKKNSKIYIKQVEKGSHTCTVLSTKFKQLMQYLKNG